VERTSTILSIEMTANIELAEIIAPLALKRRRSCVPACAYFEGFASLAAGAIGIFFSVI
jgi:hypothetical protein